MKGAEIKCYERIIIDHNTDNADEGGKIITTAVPKLSTGDAPPQAAPPDVTKSQAPANAYASILLTYAHHPCTDPR